MTRADNNENAERLAADLLPTCPRCSDLCPEHAIYCPRCGTRLYERTDPRYDRPA